MPPDLVRLYESVARQHGLFVHLLPPPLADWSRGYYLLFRIIDTAEDALVPAEDKAELLTTAGHDFWSGLEAIGRRLEADEGVAHRHREVLRQRESIRRWHEEQPKAVQEMVEKTGREMAVGMAAYLMQWAAAGHAWFIKDLEDLGHYCFFAAGCVGALNHELFRIAGALSPAAALLHAESVALGEYLQLVNIIRDSAKDAAGKRKSYVPIELSQKTPAEQLAALIGLASGKEAAVNRYLAALPPGGARDYCRTLYRVAAAHFTFYAENPDIMTRLRKPPASALWAVLPWSLRWRFLLHKLGR